jgi:excisionase family DNA binding protein
VIEQHYTTAELCQRLGLHEETVRKYARTGQLPSVRFGKDRRYPESGVVKFLAERADRLHDRAPA